MKFNWQPRSTFVIGCVLLFASSVAWSQGNPSPANATPGGVGSTHTEVAIPDLDWAQVRSVVATATGGFPASASAAEATGIWRFDVTVEHNDEGWDHYADAWDVVDPTTQEVLATRVLLHPHENEQPFTRSLSDIEIVESISAVLVRARCQVHGYGGAEILVDLLSSGDENYEVRRP